MFAGVERAVRDAAGGVENPHRTATNRRTPMGRQADPETQYTGDGERENPEQMPNIASDPTELPQEEPADPAGDDGDSDAEGSRH
jgi:hypothetical protein